MIEICTQKKSAKPIKFSDGSMKIDMTTANMMLQVLDKINMTCRLSSFCIPEPQALLVNRMPIKNILNSNLSHYQLITENSNKSNLESVWESVFQRFYAVHVGLGGP